jgi:hypothetical protein
MQNHAISGQRRDMHPHTDRLLSSLWLLIVLLLAAPTAFSIANADTPASPIYPLPAHTPPPGHPRVYFTTHDLARLRDNLTHPQNAAALQAHQQNLATGTDGRLLPPASADAGNMDSAVLAIIESYAYDYALHANADHGRKAISALRNYLSTVKYPPRDYNNTGQTVFTIAAVYDRCYPLLTPDDRQYLIQATLDTAALMEIGWPPVNQGNVTGHGPEGQLFRDLLAAGIALYDEKPEIYNLVAGRILAQMVETKHFMYPAHMHHQGNHYANYRGQWELLATWLFDRIGLPKLFGPDQQYFMYWTMYARRPDGQILRDGDTHINNRPPGDYFASAYRPMFLAANYFNDPHLKQAALNQRANFAPTPPRSNQSINPVETLIFNNPAVEPRPLSELPLSKYFPSPKGAMIARTSWDEGITSPAVVAEMKINEWYFANHQHLDAGAFQIYYRGALALDSGYYQGAINKTDTPANEGSTGYGSLYDINYYKRTIAHNTITVFDPNEVFDSKRWAKSPIANDGGQRFPNRWIEPKEHADLINPENRHRIAEVLGHGFGPDSLRPEYTYLKGDLTQAYSEKVQAFERTFLFLNLNLPDHPAALVVLDRVVSADPTFRKAWLLHGLEQPTINGNQAIFKDTRPGYTGKLTVDTLLPTPDNTTITPVGVKDHSVMVNGTAYRGLPRPGGNNEGGQWRIEVSPKTPSQSDHFLHVLQVGDHTPTDTPPLPVQAIDAQSHIGIQIADRVALFSKTRDRTVNPVFFAFESPTTAKVLVADLQPGQWHVEHNGNPLTTLTVSPADGIAYFIAPPGSLRLIPSKE